METNGIRHVTSTLLHPATNGLAECLAQSFKNGIKADQTDRPLQHKLDRVLLAYHITAHASTRIALAQILFGRNLRSRLDLLKPNVKRHVDRKLLQDLHRLKCEKMSGYVNITGNRIGCKARYLSVPDQ